MRREESPSRSNVSNHLLLLVTSRTLLCATGKLRSLPRLIKKKTPWACVLFVRERENERETMSCSLLQEREEGYYVFVQPDEERRGRENIN